VNLFTSYYKRIAFFEFRDSRGNQLDWYSAGLLKPFDHGHRRRFAPTASDQVLYLGIWIKQVADRSEDSLSGHGASLRCYR